MVSSAKKQTKTNETTFEKDVIVAQVLFYWCLESNGRPERPKPLRNDRNKSNQLPLQIQTSLCHRETNRLESFCLPTSAGELKITNRAWRWR